MIIKIQKPDMEMSDIKIEIKEKLKARKQELIDKFYEKEKQTALEEEYTINFEPYPYAYEPDMEELIANEGNAEQDFIDKFSEILHITSNKSERKAVLNDMFKAYHETFQPSR